MLILWFASPFYHSLPENATRSRVPRLNAPKWAHPAHTYLAMSPVAHPVGAGVPDGPFSVLRLRAAPASCIYASGGHISFNSERNMEKNAAKNRRFLDFPFVRL